MSASLSISHRLSLLGLLTVLGIWGCRQDVPIREVISLLPVEEDEVLTISARHAWTDTGIDVEQGEPISLAAWGQIDPGPRTLLTDSGSVRPAGTYYYADRCLGELFPLPAVQDGPAPCFCLIGRIGDGEPFYVGERLSFAAPASGRLLLGINDFDTSDNSGDFLVRLAFPDDLQPVRFEEQVHRETSFVAARQKPVPNARVMVFYLDGLRPDVVREMAAMGHIPTINRLFVEGGTWLGNTFTGFPSDTITSNGTMWTGCFSDRHGLKGQVRFSRRTLQSESYLEPLGPNRSSRLLQPTGYDWALQRAEAETRNVTLGSGSGDRWEQSRTSGIPPLYEHLRRNGSDWATGVLPMMTEVPPMLWTRSLIRQMPYFRAQEAWNYIDDANTHFALKHLIARDMPVTIVWLPETDSVSHKRSRGQFGITRRTIALADRMIEQMVRSIERQGLLDSTYFMLVSDHGHHGGRESFLTHYDLADQLFHRPREVNSQGEWVGGGLGLSVRQHRFWNQHPEDNSVQFVFVDGDSDGAARVFLPKGHFRSGAWMGTSRPADLLRYRLAEHVEPVNLPQAIVAAVAVDGRGFSTHPVDLVLMRLSETSILITTRDRGQAVIDRRLTAESEWVYRYRVVANVRPVDGGEVAYDVVERPAVDPLEILTILPAAAAADFLDERTWLRITTRTRYPDSVVALSRHMFWQQNLKYREDEFAPDLVVTAQPNWYFGIDSSPGTMHGYPLSDSMRATWFVSGPNIRRGARIHDPSRLVDLTPTILHLTGTEVDFDEFDGRIITEMFETATSSEMAAAAEPLYWRDVDLRAWEAIPYLPAAPYEHLPWTMNRPDSGWDLNNIAYNVIALGDISVLRLFDDVLSPLTGGRQPIVSTFEETETRLWGINQPVGEAGRVLDLSGVTLSDYSQTSVGNIQRVDRAIDWVQKRQQEVDRKLAEPFGAEQTIPSQVFNGSVDLAQRAVWGTYRFVQRVVIQVLDETVLNGFENGVDRTVNRFRQVPAEVQVED